jgi:hypothetical protein
MDGWDTHLTLCLLGGCIGEEHLLGRFVFGFLGRLEGGGDRGVGDEVRGVMCE